MRYSRLVGAPDPEPSTGASRDEAPTIAASPAAVSARPRPLSGHPSDTPPGSGETSELTPRETLFREEIVRTRVFVVVAGLLAAVAFVTLSWLAPRSGGRQTLLAGLGFLTVHCAWFGWALRRREAYSAARGAWLTFAGILTCYVAIWYFGLFSAAVALVPFGLAFSGLGQSRATAFGAYAACAGLYALLSILVLTGLRQDSGLLGTGGLPKPVLVAAAILVQGIFLSTFVVQRRSRDATIEALERHDRVIRSLALRDALLREARLDLAQALHVGGAGWWTDEVVGEFRLEKVIGRGAMGEVYEATRLTGGRAAVKLLHPHVLAQPDFVQRFVREARAVASLDVANVVQVLDVSPPDARVPYIAMERLVGRDLSDLLREHKRMGVRAVQAMLREVGAGLDAVRVAGIVHRDLKPRNLFWAHQEERDVWKILDFGVARVAGDETMTQDQIVGTPNYMAPEQAQGAAVTHRTDLFALGVIAYRALTGHPAFEGQTTAEILFKVVHTMPLRPSVAAPLAAEVDLVLAIATAKEPAERFASAMEFASALEVAARGQIDATLRIRAERLLARLPWTSAPE
jgi:eukaryotic-like serine/threonine-protein kinase